MCSRPDGASRRRSLRSARPYRPRFDARDLPAHARGRPAPPSTTSTGARSRISTAASAPRTPLRRPIRPSRSCGCAGCWTPIPAARGWPSATGAVAGVAMALLREGLWGLSLLVVDPGAQGDGAGRELLALAHAYGNGARGRVILSSSDPRAMRAYARLGLELHPAVAATGAPQGAAMPADVRPGGPDDLAAHRGGRPRGARRRPRRGRARDAPGRPRAARAPGARLRDAARAARSACWPRSTTTAPARVLRGALARVAELGETAHLEFLTARQQWAIDVCLETPAGPAGRLRLRVHRRRRGAVLALPPERCVPVPFGSS